jgi:hypothetical protein
MTVKISAVKFAFHLEGPQRVGSLLSVLSSVGEARHVNMHDTIQGSATKLGKVSSQLSED